MAELTLDLHQLEDVVAKRYRIHTLLGCGDTTATYQAEDLNSHHWVVLKVVSFQHPDRPDLLPELGREAEALEKIDHPGVPHYLDHFSVKTTNHCRLYWVQEFAAGKSLDQWVAEGWQASEAEAQQLAAEMLDILVYLHQLEPPIIHRNIQPQNIIRQVDGRISLVNFGAVPLADSDASQPLGSSAGIASHHLPEQHEGIATVATDLYGLGATLVYLLIHRSPDELSREQMRIAFRMQANCSKAFVAWLEKMLAPGLKERWGDAAIALQQLKTFMTQPKCSNRKKTKREPAPEQFLRTLELSRGREAYIYRKSSYFNLYVKPSFSTQLLSTLSILVPLFLLIFIWAAILISITIHPVFFKALDPSYSSNVLEPVISLLTVMGILCGIFIGSFYLVIKAAIHCSNEIYWAKIGWNFFKVQNGYCMASLRLCGLNRRTKFFSLKNVRGIEIQKCLVAIEAEDSGMLQSILESDLFYGTRQYAERLQLKIRDEDEVPFGGALTIEEMEQLKNYFNYFLLALKQQGNNRKSWIESVQRLVPAFQNKGFWANFMSR